MSQALALSAQELAQVRAILAAHLPPGVTVSVFGSRAAGAGKPAPKPWSDLDLALEGESPLPLSLMAELAEAFDESALPWKVDLVDGKAISAGFAAIVKAGCVPLDLTARPEA